MLKLNIELLDMIRLTAQARRRVRGGEAFIRPAGISSVGGRSFRFAADPAGGKPAAEVNRVDEWLAELAARGAEDFSLIMPDHIDSYERLGRLNGISCCIICFYRDRATSWNKLWSYDDGTGNYSVSLIEIPVEHKHDKPVFRDVTDSMKELFTRLERLSSELGQTGFERRFRKAGEALDDRTDTVYGRLLSAAVEAYVFGGEGSWNDSVAFLAAGRGLAEEYGFLTRELYRGIALSVMYAVNEW